MNQNTSTKIVALASGGMDSTVLLHHHLGQKFPVRAISFSYGQRHVKELEYAIRQAKLLHIPLHVVDLSPLRDALPGSSQTDAGVAVPEGRYDEESMKATVVPNRNMILLSIAIGHAIAHHYNAVSYAAHAGDHAIYPDCRPEFVEALQRAVNLCDWTQIQLFRPFVHLSKAHLVDMGMKLGVDFTQTWSCYKGEELHCGRCGTCIERREAFHLAGVPDPTLYDAKALPVEQMVENGWKL